MVNIRAVATVRVRSYGGCYGLRVMSYGLYRLGL